MVVEPLEPDVLESSLGAPTAGFTSLEGEAERGSDAALATEDRPEIEGADGRREVDATGGRGSATLGGLERAREGGRWAVVDCGLLGVGDCSSHLGVSSSSLSSELSEQTQARTHLRSRVLGSSFLVQQQADPRRSHKHSMALFAREVALPSDRAVVLAARGVEFHSAPLASSKGSLTDESNVACTRSDLYPRR